MIPINLKDGSIEQSTPKDIIIGIDLGTTNSLVAYTSPNGETLAVKDNTGQRTLVPSVLHFCEDGRILVGDEAKEMLIKDPANTIYSVKRLMGKSYQDVHNTQAYFGYQILDNDTDSLVKVRVKDQFYTPVELSALILAHLKKRIESLLNQEISKAVITVPAYFNDAQRQATRDAGKLAGLDVLRIVNEPTAASLAYGIDQAEGDKQTIAVYDLGGGTFDISILQIQDGIFEVLATNGDTYLGGDDLDRAIIDYWIATNNLDKTIFQQDKSLNQALRLAAEAAKKQLSSDDYYNYQLENIKCELSRSQLNELITPLIQKTIDCCKRALADASLQVIDIDHVVMVGGSTRVPLVKEMVSTFFNKSVNDKLNPDEVVALGAAIQADILAGNQRNLLLLDITPLSLGIETVGGLMDTIIPRNSKVPTRAGRQYTTSVDGQKNLKVAVYQGERDLVEHNRKLGEFILSNIPPMPAGLPKIDIHFIINADGILTVKAKELRSDVATQVEIKSAYGISEEEMALMLIDSIKNAQSDMAARGLLEARNEANNIVLSADKFLIQNASILSAAEVSETQNLTNALRAAAAQDNKDAIQAAMTSLNEYTAPLAHRAMDYTIGESLKGRKL